MPEYLLPGVFVEELAHLPPAVVDVDSAVPAFVGYTAQATRSKTGDLRRVAQRIRSLAEFEALYGKAAPGVVQRVDVDKQGVFQSASMAMTYYLYDALRLFYENGGGDCYIVSVGGFSASGRVSASTLLAGMRALAAVDGVSLLLCPDGVALGAASRAKLQQAALAQCAEMRDRFAVFDSALDDLVVDVGDVADVGHVVTGGLQPAVNHVENHHHAGVAEVAVVIDGHAADVHANLVRFDGGEYLFFAFQRVVDL